MCLVFRTQNDQCATQFISNIKYVFTIYPDRHSNLKPKTVVHGHDAGCEFPAQAAVVQGGRANGQEPCWDKLLRRLLSTRPQKTMSGQLCTGRAVGSCWAFWKWLAGLARTAGRSLLLVPNPKRFQRHSFRHLPPPPLPRLLSPPLLLSSRLRLSKKSLIVSPIYRWVGRGAKTFIFTSHKLIALAGGGERRKNVHVNFTQAQKPSCTLHAKSLLEWNGVGLAREPALGWHKNNLEHTKRNLPCWRSL